MAKIGLSKPVFAVYTNSGTTVTYSGAKYMGKAVNLELSLDSSDKNILYADNAPAESDNQFAGGKISITTDELDPAIAKTLLGIQEETVTISGMVTTGVKAYSWDNRQTTPYVGFGAIYKAKVNGAVKYQPVVFNKVMFKNNGETVATQGDTVSWQTPVLEADIMRDDTANGTWKKTTSMLDSEADALLFIQSIIGTIA